MKENKTKMKAMGEDNSRSWAWIIFILIVFFVSLAFAVKPSNETSSYFEATGDMTGQIKVKGVQLKIYQDTGEGYKDVTKDGFDLDTNYFVTDRSYNYDMIIKNDDKATVKAEEYYLRWWFSANIDGTEYDITDYCSVDTAFVYKQDDSDGKTRFYSVNGYNSNVISAQTQLTFLSRINFKGQYDSSTGEYGSILDKEASGSKIKITAHIEGSLEPYEINDPVVKFYDFDGELLWEEELGEGQNTITIIREAGGDLELDDGEILYFQGWIKNGVVSKVYTPNETVEVKGGDVFTLYYAEDPDYSDYTFTVDSVTGEYILACANKDITIATIPALYQGQIVSVVSDNAFYQYSSLQTVKLPQTITKIGEAAFQECTNLTSITIPDSVTEIGNRAFWTCTKLETIDLGNGVESIGACAFYCSGLTTITIPDGVTEIKDLTFWKCSNLLLINIPASVTSINMETGDHPFVDCTSLTAINVDSANENYSSIDGVLFDKEATKIIYFPQGKTGSFTIPASVTTVTSSTFSGCTGLTAINVDSANENYSSIDGVVYNKSGTILVAYPVGRTDSSYTISSSVTRINSGAFKGCVHLSTIVFEDTTGWFTTRISSTSGGTSIDVTDPSVNAENLTTGSWTSLYIKKK